MRYVGIDLHKRLLVASIVDEHGKVLATPRIEEVTRRSLLEFCRQHLHPSDHVALEVTTHVWAVFRILAQHVARVVASNPVATKAIAQAKIKTDKVDAEVLAQIAVCAVASKLAMLAWHLLKEGKPYRYAKPVTVAAKLAKLRVAGSGVRRRGGAGKGVDARSMRAPEERNLRRTPSLPDVLRKEGLPAPSDPKQGEQRVLEQTGTKKYFESLQHERTRPRKDTAKDNPPVIPQDSAELHGG